MDIVTLPLLRSHANVDEALTALKQHRRSGLVLGGNQGYTLFYIGDLLSAQDQSIKQLRDVPGGRGVLILDNDKARAFELDLERPDRTRSSYESMLTSEGLDYALVAEANDVVTVVTLHERQGLALTMTGGYRCTGTPRHYFPEPRVSVSDQCPLYPQCKTPDGSIPTIRPA